MTVYAIVRLKLLEISKDRKAGAEGVVLLANGFTPGG